MNFRITTSGALTFHLLISHFRYIGLTARTFDSHIDQSAVRVQINVYILIDLFSLSYLLI